MKSKNQIQAEHLLTIPDSHILATIRQVTNAQTHYISVEFNALRGFIRQITKL